MYIYVIYIYHMYVYNIHSICMKICMCLFGPDPSIDHFPVLIDYRVHGIGINECLYVEGKTHQENIEPHAPVLKQFKTTWKTPTSWWFIIMLPSLSRPSSWSSHQAAFLAGFRLPPQGPALKALRLERLRSGHRNSLTCIYWECNPEPWFLVSWGHYHLPRYINSDLLQCGIPWKPCCGNHGPFDFEKFCVLKLGCLIAICSIARG